MALFESAKKIETLTGEIATLTANLGTMTALAESRLADAGALTEKLALAEAASAKAVADISAKLIAADAALAVEKSAHEATKVSVKAQAAIEAQTILSQAGQPPVKVTTEAQKSKEEIVSEFNAMSPGAARSAFFAKHKKHLI